METHIMSLHTPSTPTPVVGSKGFKMFAGNSHVYQIKENRT